MDRQYINMNKLLTALPRTLSQGFYTNCLKVTTALHEYFGFLRYMTYQLSFCLKNPVLNFLDSLTNGVHPELAIYAVFV